MRYIDIPGTELKVSNIVMGCMRITQLTKEQLEAHIRTALDEGVNFFDHADIYGGGESEALFARAAAGLPRDKMLIQSKCGIGRGYYDFSKAHILGAVDGILSRLNTDYLDVLLLHRPDSLMEPEEVAEAFDMLEKSGKVRYFGVSNQNRYQMELLGSRVKQPLLFNQMQMSVVHTPLLDSGIAVNMGIPQSVDRVGGTLEYCRLKGITLQAWSPFQKGFFEGPYLGDNEKYAELNKVTGELADKYGVTPAGIAVAWLTRHPANMQVVLGTTNAQRLKEGCAGADIPLTRPEWYAMYQAAGNMLP